MSSDAVVQATRLGKSYAASAQPSDRLVQMLREGLGRLAGSRTPAPSATEFHALRGISLCVSRGETVGIIGRNGSGKSTLLQLLCGTLQATTGQVEVRGRVAALLELGSGFHPEFSGRENVFLNAAVLGLSRQQTAERFDAIAAFADIGEFMDRPLKSYSSGMAMRLAFSVIAHVDADILVIDEALSVGDAFFTQKCMRYLRTFMKTGTVIFVSHDIEAVKALCSRVIWLDAGAVRRDGPTKAVCQDYLDALLANGSGPAAPRAATVDGLDFPTASEPVPLSDPRQDEWRRHSLSNDIHVFSFDSGQAGPGAGGCTIRSVVMAGANGGDVPWIVGGEMVRLEVDVECHEPLHSPIVGFMVKDRTGQAIFGDNTWLSYLDSPMAADSGQRLRAAFVFDMPRLPAGDYTMVVAVADGTQQENVMHHWLHDALRFRSESSNVANGLVGIPMRRITLEKAAEQSGGES